MGWQRSKLSSKRTADEERKRIPGMKVGFVG